jgi:proline iminopeptidase
MQIADSQIGASARLYPLLQPFSQGMLDVGDGHSVYYEECGNPNGIPVVVLHGGPGGGCSPGMRRFFHPDIFRVILFDQRGCGRSTPHASVEHNTTYHLIDDIEFIRKKLGIDQWILFGGSWGSTLALLYAQAHPDHVLNMVLRGIFLMTDRELDWFYEGGVSRFFPDLWDHFIADIPENERDNIIAAYQRRLFGTPEPVQTKFARSWTNWENSLASMIPRNGGGNAPAHYARAFARIENHYFFNKGFLKPEDAILDNMHKIKHIPGTIVQGRYDLICPPETAYTLYNQWSKSELIVVSDAGHSMSERGITAQLVTILDNIS